MTQEEIDKFRIKEKLDICEKELHNIEFTADKSRRQRWRELNKLIKHYKTILNRVNMNDVWLKPTQILQNKCRGRNHWESFEEMVEWCQTKCPVQCRYDKRYPFEDSYVVPGLGGFTKDQFEKLRTCTIAFTTIPDRDINGHEVHQYFTAYGHDGAVFVKSFKDGVLETTRNEIEAKHFYSDDEADKVLEYIRDTQHPWTIALQDFKGNKSVSACVHYPNNYWNNNGYLQPSLMHKTVQEWNEEHGQQYKENKI